MKIVLSEEIPAKLPLPTLGSFRPGDCFATRATGLVYMVVDAFASDSDSRSIPSPAGKRVVVRLSTGTVAFFPRSWTVIPVDARIVIDPPATLPERPVVDSPFYNPR